MENTKAIVWFLILLMSVMSTQAITLSDQGTGLTDISSDSLLEMGNITIQVWDSLTGGNILYNYTFTDAIVNGSWNIMLGESPGPNLDIDYGSIYYRDYKINNEDTDFIDGNGATVERIIFQSPLGDIDASTYIEDNSITSDKLDVMNMTFDTFLDFNLGAVIRNIVSGWLELDSNVNVTGNLTANGQSVCLADGTGCPSGTIDTQKGTSGKYVYNNSIEIMFNESELNSTINSLDSDTLGTLSCSNNEIAKYNTSGWICAIDVSGSGADGQGINSSTTKYLYDDGSIVGFNESELNSTIDARDDYEANTDVLNGLSCSVNEVAKYNGTGWECSVDVSGGTLSQDEVGDYEINYI